MGNTETRVVDFKTIFLERFEPEIRSREIRSILDLGSGLSQNFIPLLEKFPSLKYVGVEPSEKHANLARERLTRFSGVEIFKDSGYEPVAPKDIKWGDFDLVISLSVLEHVKQLERFLSNSVSASRSGGRIVHRWDLGHALYPSSIKECFQVFLGDRFPVLLSESKFVSTLLPSRVEKILSTLPARIEDVTYHQMPGSKKLLKSAPHLPEELKRSIIELEFSLSRHLEGLGEVEKCRLFPAPAIWARKV